MGEQKKSIRSRGKVEVKMQFNGIVTAYAIILEQWNYISVR